MTGNLQGERVVRDRLSGFVVSSIWIVAPSSRNDAKGQRKRERKIVRRIRIL